MFVATEKCKRYYMPMIRSLLLFQSFYNPGSTDVHNQQLDDWNLQPPSLYLWSHRDWTPRHRALAEKQGHLVQGMVGKNAPNPMRSTIHNTDNVTVDMETSSSYPPPRGELQLQGFQNTGQCPISTNSPLTHHSSSTRIHSLRGAL